MPYSGPFPFSFTRVRGLFNYAATPNTSNTGNYLRFSFYWIF